MKQALLVLLACLWALGSAAPARAAEEAAPVAADGAAHREAVKEEAEKLATVAGDKVKDFAERVDEQLGQMTANRVLGWGLAAVGALIGGLCMFFGWTLVKSLLIPFAPVLGLTTGGVVAFCLIEAFYAGEGRPPLFRIIVLGVGAVLGVAAYLFSALRAKPVAAFLVVLSPFLIISCILFSYNVFTYGEIAALVLFCTGFLMGFAAMVEVRPVSILSTSLLGATVLVTVLGLASHLLENELRAPRDFFSWLIENPAMLGIGIATLVIVGAGFQFSTGPRGTLEG